MSKILIVREILVLVNKYVPAEYVFDFATLDSLDVVVELEGLRSALAVAVEIYGLLARLKERLVTKLVYRSDHYCSTALADFLECRELVNMHRSSLYLHTEMSRYGLERHVGD